MNIPNFIETRVVDENGNWTQPWAFIMEQLLTQLQLNAGIEGLVIPNLTVDKVALLTESQNGALIYDSTNNQAKVNINGTFKVIQTA